MSYSRLALALIASVACTTAGQAQTAPAQPAENGATQPITPPIGEAQTDTQSGTATTADECAREFQTLDGDGNGFLTAAESPRDLARASIDGIPTGTEGLSHEEFLQACSSANWTATPEAGAPFEGANSFTEAQAQERATAWNVTEVSALTLDDKGIWRGTGKVGTNAVAVAIDFKGNVVTTPTQN